MTANSPKDPVSGPSTGDATICKEPPLSPSYATLLMCPPWGSPTPEGVRHECPQLQRSTNDAKTRGPKTKMDFDSLSTPLDDTAPYRPGRRVSLDHSLLPPPLEPRMVSDFCSPSLHSSSPTTQAQSLVGSNMTHASSSLGKHAALTANQLPHSSFRDAQCDHPLDAMFVASNSELSPDPVDHWGWRR